MKFDNATIYLRGMFGVSRIDVREVEVTSEKYAQYDECPTVRYKEVRKRKLAGQYLTGRNPFLVVVRREDAVEPDNPLVPCGPTSRKSRYPSCDPRWVGDFATKLKLAKVQPLYAIGVEGAGGDA